MKISRDAVWLIGVVLVVAVLTALQASSGTPRTDASDVRGRPLVSSPTPAVGPPPTRGVGPWASAPFADVRWQHRQGPWYEPYNEVRVLSKRERDEAMADLAGTLQQFRILPNKKSGHAYGSRIVYLARQSYLWKLGFRQDDIILTFQDRPVNDAEQGLACFGSVADDDAFEFQVERKGLIRRHRIEFQ